MLPDNYSINDYNINVTSLGWYISIKGKKNIYMHKNGKLYGWCGKLNFYETKEEAILALKQKFNMITKKNVINFFKPLNELFEI
jgi:hypothetical protein